MKTVKTMQKKLWLGWAKAVFFLGLVLGMSPWAVADALPQSVNAPQPNMSGAVMVKNILNNVGAAPQVHGLTTPVATATATTATAATTPTPSAQTMNAEPVGRVVWVKGEFMAMLKNGAQSNERSLEKASVIYLHDTLVTGNDSQAQIVFTDNTLMTFKPASKFYINQYAYNANSNQKSVGKYIMNLMQGGFRTITGLIAKSNPSDYQMNTPVATIGVRGTDYTLVLKDQGIYLGQNTGEPCIKSNEENLCLNKTTRYATVASRGMAPMVISQPPAFMVEPITVEHVTVTEVSSAPLSKTVTTTSPPAGATSQTGSSTTTTTTTTSQPAIGGSTSGGSSSGSDFCIR